MKVTLLCQSSDEAAPDIEPIGAPPNPIAALSRLGLHGLRRRLDSLVYFPSPTRLFVARATKWIDRVAREELARGRSVTLVTCVPPHDLLVAGLEAKRRVPGMRWVLDWGDPWTMDENYRPAHPRRRMKIETMERSAIRSADANVVTNERAAELFRERLGCEPDRLHVIRHAYAERETSTALPPAVRTEVNASGQPTYRIGFLGNLMKPPKVPGSDFLQAVRHARAEGLDIRVTVIGDRILDRERDRYSADAGWLEIIGRQPHEMAIQRVSRCDFVATVLSRDPRSAWVVPMKLPYYLAIGRPVIAFVPEDSATADVLRETNSGFVIRDDESWEQGLVRVLTTENAARPRGTNGGTERYEWANVRDLWQRVVLDRQPDG